MADDKRVPAEHVEVALPSGADARQALAELRIGPFTRHGVATNYTASSAIKSADGTKCNSAEVGKAVEKLADQLARGDLRPVTDMLMAQAVLLDTTISDLMCRAWMNVGAYPEAHDRYLRLAFKAQAQSRATLEALAKIHQPREQIVRHVHVNEGGQAIVADQVAIAVPGEGSVVTADQCHAARTRGLGKRAALSGPDPLGRGMSVPSGAREATVSHARRDKPRRSTRKQQRSEARSEDRGND